MILWINVKLTFTNQLDREALPIMSGAFFRLVQTKVWVCVWVAGNIKPAESITMRVFRCSWRKRGLSSDQHQILLNID
jgi:hypothetical protein